MPETLDSSRLLAVIATQNEIAASELDSDAVMRVVADRARELTGAAASIIEIPEAEEMVYRVATGTAAEYVGIRLGLHTSLSGRCVLEGEVLHCRDSQTDPRVDAAAVKKVGARSMICVPLRHGGEVAGVLKVTSPEADAFDAGDVTVLGLLSGVIAAHMAHAQDYEVVQRQSRQDPLTGLGNRRAFEENLAAAVRLAVRKDRPLALCLFDVDRFKQVNDEHGHPAGDGVLTGIGAILGNGRAGDLAYRLGGDEFALIMPETTTEGAAIAASRICRAVGAQVMGSVTASVSAGWAERTPEGDADDLYGAADVALYEAKANRSPVGT